MLRTPAQGARIWVCREPTDMRRSFDGLSALVEHVLRQDPLSGHWFVFRNRRGDLLKILLWEGDGYAIWAKRLEAGTFRFPPERTELSVAELLLVLDGVEWSELRRRVRYQYNYVNK